MSTVALIKGSERRHIIKKSLDFIKDDILQELTRHAQVIIKPNFVSLSRPLAVSHVDQIRGILDFLRENYHGKVIIGEAACGDTKKAFEIYGYMSLVEEYGVELVDFNQGPFEPLPIHDAMGYPLKVRVARQLLDKSNYIISAAKLKTHDTVVVTLSIKNVVMGAIYVHDKVKVHQGIKRINLNIADLARDLWPHLAVIDGFEGMEGDGPSNGTPIHVGVAISSTDPLSADRVACEIMGVNMFNVGYLYYCHERGYGEGDLSRILIKGDELKTCIKPFKLHSKVEDQFKWR